MKGLLGGRWGLELRAKPSLVLRALNKILALDLTVMVIVFSVDSTANKERPWILCISPWVEVEKM